jgi:Fis family transcriptional regulator
MNAARKSGVGSRVVASLRDNVREATECYFRDMDGHDPAGLYDLFMSEVEKPLFEVVMKNTKGNISRAAQLLGLNRATLRSRLDKYGIDA